MNENLPIRLFFSKYLKFQEDKYLNPNVFCWIGYHMTSENKNTSLTEVENLFNKHKALFVDSDEKEIKATIFNHLNENQILETFNDFYKYNIIYDLILKWIHEEGEYNFDYKWLSNKSSEELIPSIKNGFMKTFNISIDNLKIL